MSPDMASIAKFWAPSENTCGADPRRSGRRSGPPARRAGRPSKRAGASALAGGPADPAVRGRPGVGADGGRGAEGANHEAENIGGLLVGGDVDHANRLEEDGRAEQEVDHDVVVGVPRLGARERGKVPSGGRDEDDEDGGGGDHERPRPR